MKKHLIPNEYVTPFLFYVTLFLFSVAGIYIILQVIIAVCCD